MLNYKINNQDEIDNFFKYARENNLNCYAIKGKAPEGAMYEDGTLISNNINIGWEMEYLGRQVYIQYVKKENNVV